MGHFNPIGINVIVSLELFFFSLCLGCNVSIIYLINAVGEDL